ncbi:bifunctional phosphoribosylaminoimidazolecarboxamide formyltransferase/IMP cyclohydrolase [Candidatus Poribacteria bacterium]|nr:bifunctional phosphoribosylaminoimidazolecarboxamide formyltransferase/IMP cyclohydrolase [Candidatus Poribacteria bacterium]
MNKIKLALVSVSDKTGIVEFAQELAQLDIKILSTGGTARLLTESGIPVREVSDYTGFPEMMDGRLKTLHPKIHGGLLALRDNVEHTNQAKEHGIEFIDMVVVNLYPFESTIAKPNVELSEAIENIDIGGPTMIRSAAKNYRYVAVVTNPGQYESVIVELKQNAGALSSETKFELAKAAFAHTAHYDTVISNYLAGLDQPSATEFPLALELKYEKAQDLRYGENPHQKAAFYRGPVLSEPSVANARQLHGKELSFNNILDLHAALELVKDFAEPTVAIIKHNNPCGVASHDSLTQAYRDALDCDPLSAFGSIVALNREVDLETAEAIRQAAQAGSHPEAIIAPGYTEDALKRLRRSRDLRLMEVGKLGARNPQVKEIKTVLGGILVQERDLHELKLSDLKVVTAKQPTPEQIEAMMFAWKVCKHVKSNTILLAQGKKTVGIGAGQMSRVDSSIIAARKAGDRATGAVLASDAMIPFRDGVDAAAQAGVAAIIQTGGSMRDEEVIVAANEHGMAMVFTGVRHFKH